MRDCQTDNYQTNESNDLHRDGWTGGRTNGRTEGWTDGRTDGRTEGWTDERTDGRTNGRMGGRTDIRSMWSVPAGKKVNRSIISNEACTIIVVYYNYMLFAVVICA